MPDPRTIEFYAKNAADLSVGYNDIKLAFLTRVKELAREGGRVLDIGCGSGRDLAVFHSMGMEVMGIEPVAEFRLAAELAHPILKGKLLEGSLPVDIPGGIGKFNLVHCSAVLMHLTNRELEQSISMICGLLYPDALLHLSFCPERPGVDSSSRAPEGRLFNPIDPHQLKEVVRRQGFEVVDESLRDDAMDRPGICWISLTFRRVTQ